MAVAYQGHFLRGGGGRCQEQVLESVSKTLKYITSHADDCGIVQLY